MKNSTIHIDVQLDDKNLPEQIKWNASDSSLVREQEAKAMMLTFWDGVDKSALRIDLWTKNMMVDEMADFYYQSLMAMADSFQRSTGKKQLVEDMKEFAKDFYKKFRDLDFGENKA
jgi:gliding motility-associated protein GldC